MQVWIEMFKCLSVHSALCHISKVIMKVHKVLKWVKNNSKVQQIAFNINVKTIIHIHLIAVYVQLSVQEHCIQFALKHIPLYYCISIISTIFRRMLKSMLFFHKDKLQKWLKSTIKVNINFQHSTEVVDGFYNNSMMHFVLFGGQKSLSPLEKTGTFC